MHNYRMTSVEAYSEMVDSGKRDTQKAIVLNGVIDNGPVTRNELAVILQLPVASVCGRVKEMLDDRLIKDDSTRECAITGKVVHILEPINDTDAGRVDDAGQMSFC